MKSVRTIILIFIAVLLCKEVTADGRSVVLVAASNSPLQNLDSLELRKIYLGFTVKRDDRNIKGLRNNVDENINSIFLQNVVAMTQKSYDKRLLFMALRKGTPHPPVYDSVEDLLAALSTNPYSVSFMWKEDAARSSQVKILGLLWHQN